MPVKVSTVKITFSAERYLHWSCWTNWVTERCTTNIKQKNILTNKQQERDCNYEFLTDEEYAKSCNPEKCPVFEKIIDLIPGSGQDISHGVSKYIKQLNVVSFIYLESCFMGSKKQ